MCNLGAAASLAALFQGCSQETPSQMELAGQEETGTQQVPDRTGCVATTVLLGYSRDLTG